VWQTRLQSKKEKFLLQHSYILGFLDSFDLLFFAISITMMSRGGAKVVASLLKSARPRLFSTATTSTIRSMSHETSHLLKPAAADLAGVNTWIWSGAGGVRFASTASLGEKTPSQDENPKKTEDESSTGGNKGIASYWGVEPNKITKEDGTEWKWNCFRVRFYIYNRYIFMNYYMIWDLLGLLAAMGDV